MLLMMLLLHLLLHCCCCCCVHRNFRSEGKAADSSQAFSLIEEITWDFEGLHCRFLSVLSLLLIVTQGNEIDLKRKFSTDTWTRIDMGEKGNWKCDLGQAIY